MARRQVQIFINGKQVANQIKAITDAKRTLVRELARMDVGSKDYVATMAKIKQLNKPINEHKNALKGVETTWERLTGGAKKFLSVSNVATIAGIAGITLGAEAAFDAVRDTVKEVNQLRREITQLTGAGGDTLDDITVKVRAIALTFDQETNEVLRAGNSLMKEFGIEAEAAFDIITEGNLRGANASGEFLQNITEYSSQFAAAGFSAEEFLNISIRAQKEGIFSDKGLDVVKEFGLRIREQTTATRDALDAAFGKSFTDEIFKGINDGSVTTAGALKRVASQMDATEVPANKLQTVIADVFAGPGEDAGLRFIQILQDSQDELFNTTGEAKDLLEAQKQMVKANEDLAFAENELAKATFGIDHGFNVFFTRLKTVGLTLLTDTIEFFEELPATFAGVSSAFNQFFENINPINIAARLGTGQKAKSVGAAYREAYLAGLEPIKTQRAAAEAFQIEQENKEAEENAKRIADREKERSRKELEREAKELEKQHKRKLQLLEKFQQQLDGLQLEQQLKLLDGELKVIAEVESAYKKHYDQLEELEREGVEDTIALRAELEGLKQKEIEDRLAAHLKELGEIALKQQQENTDAEIEEVLKGIKEKEEAEKAARAFIKETADAQSALDDESATIKERHERNLARINEEEIEKIALENQLFEATKARLGEQNSLIEDLTKAHQDKLSQIEQEAEEARNEEKVRATKERIAETISFLQEAETVVAGINNAVLSTQLKDTAFGKRLAAAQIAIQGAIATAKAVNSAVGIPFPANLGAIAVAVGTVVSTIASAKAALKEAVIPQRKHGGWGTVRGADDGKVYRARLIGQPSTGLLDHPHPVLTSSGILANEVGKEYYVSHSDLRNPAVLNHVRAIDNITQHRQRQNGGFAPTDAAQNVSGSSSTATAPAQNELKEVLSMNVQVLTKLLRDGVQLNLSDNELIAMSKHLDRLNKASGGRVLN